MWGICLDIGAFSEGLFQTVVQYTAAENGKAVITLPETAYKPEIKDILELPVSPKYIYGELVTPRNHPEMTGIICGIRWHFKQERCFYAIQVNGRIKSKRYFDEDLE